MTPWWWAILHAGKRVENRVWTTSYRGPILLHAAKGCTRDEYEGACIWMENAGVIYCVDDVPKLKDMQRGGIVGRARIVGVVSPRHQTSLSVSSDFPNVDMRWHMHDQFGFVLADVEPLPFYPCAGSLGLFNCEVPGLPEPYGP